jgi:ubiquinone/menaquinone biosynthesis C-methylase UbiE
LIAARQKWDRAASNYDFGSHGAERRWAAAKREFFAGMRGRVLFLAVGTGLDFQFFPPHREIIAIDFSPRMIARGAVRAKQYQGKIQLLTMDAQRLGFADGCFDRIYTVCTFCSVPDPVAGLRELRRVLKPGGELRMFEHTGSNWFPFNLMLHMMTPFTRLTGPELNRRTLENVRQAGFTVREVNNLFLDVVKTIVAVNGSSVRDI